MTAAPLLRFKSIPLLLVALCCLELLATSGCVVYPSGRVRVVGPPVGVSVYAGPGYYGEPAGYYYGDYPVYLYRGRACYYYHGHRVWYRSGGPRWHARRHYYNY